MKKRVVSLCVLMTLTVVCFAQQDFNQKQPIPKWKIDQLSSAIAAADRPTVFNFWATFCKPCLEEIPYYQQIVSSFDTGQISLKLVSLDMAATYPRLDSFTRKRNIYYPVIFLNETNADVFCPRVDESWSGAIPATLFVNNRTGYRKFFEKELTREEFKHEVEAMLKYKLP